MLGIGPHSSLKLVLHSSLESTLMKYYYDICTSYASVSASVLRTLTWYLLHFAWVVDDAKCILVTRVCVCVCLSAAACPHYCTDLDVTWGSGRGYPLVVHYWADLQSVHGLRCFGNITRTRKVSEYMLVLAVCVVLKLVLHLPLELTLITMISACLRPPC